MQSFVSNSEESEGVGKDFDLTNHHDNIVTGIKNIQKIYGVSSGEARQTVESAYVEYLQKLPTMLENYQALYNTIRSHRNFLKSNPVTQYSFNLLKCLHSSGKSSINLQTPSNSFVLSSPSLSFEENSVKDLSFSVFVQGTEAASFELNLFEKISQFGVKQIALTENFTLFENLKNREIDLCVCIKVKLSKSDKVLIIKMKSKGIQNVLRKLRVDSQGIDIQKEFKSSCCECRIV